MSVKYGTTIKHGDGGPDSNVCDGVGMKIRYSHGKGGEGIWVEFMGNARAA